MEARISAGMRGLVGQAGLCHLLRVFLFKDYDFKKIEKYFEKRYKRKQRMMDTGDTFKWLVEAFLPEVRKVFNFT